MEPWMLAILLKPLGALIIFGGIALPVRWLVFHKMPESKWKNILLKHRGGTKDSLCR